MTANSSKLLAPFSEASTPYICCFLGFYPIFLLSLVCCVADAVTEFFVSAVAIVAGLVTDKIWQ
jgi:hypothetical protein